MDKIHLNNQIEKVLRGENSSFLNPIDIRYVENKLRKSNYKYKKFSLFPESEKLVIYQDNLEITLFELECKSPLTHREILGALFSHNLSEEVFGDIVINKDKYYIVVLNKIKKYILSNFTKIGNKKITLIEKNIKLLIDFTPTFLEKNIQTSSLRIDSVISKLIPTSRTIAKEYLFLHKVLLNYEILNNKNYILKENDIFSIRGVGKFKLIEITPLPKKQKYKIKILKYI